MSSEASATLHPIYVEAEERWSGEGMQNETEPLDQGIILRFPRLRREKGEKDPKATEEYKEDEDESLELTARNRRGEDLSGQEGSTVEGQLKLDVAALLEFGQSPHESKLVNPNLFEFSQNAANEVDEDFMSIAFECTVRGRVVKMEVTGEKYPYRFYQAVIDTPYGYWSASGQLPDIVLSRQTGKNEQLTASHYAVGEWIVLRGFPCFDM